MGLGDPSPLDVAGERPPVLALHGFTGTPQEVALVVRTAQSLGLAARAPLLPGHGTNARDLAPTRFADWASAARDELRRIATPDEPAIVAGISMGAVVALHLGVIEPERVRALVILSNAVWLTWPFPTLALDAVRLLRLPDFQMPKSASDIADPEARRTNLTYSGQPIHAAIDLVRAGRSVRRSLPFIRCPTFVAHGALDKVCPVANARRVADRIRSTDRTVVILPRSAHIITRDYDHAELGRELGAFLARIADRPAAT
jgi:carboxylesterase